MIDWAGAEWIQCVDANDEVVGWLPRKEAISVGLKIEVVEPVRAYREDLWLNYHMRLAEESGVLKGELNRIREAVLIGLAVIRAARESEKAEATLLQQLAIHRPDAYQQYKDRMEAEQVIETDEGGDITWVSPKSAEEFMSMLGEGWGDELEEVPLDGPFGAAGAVLSDDEWNQLGD